MSNEQQSIECELVDEPPAPQDSAKNQAEGHDLAPKVYNPSKGLTVDDTISGLIACNPKALRDEATARIISSLNLDKAREIKSLREELDVRETTINELRGKLSDALDEKRSLGADLKISQAEVKTSRQDGDIKAVAGVVGTALLGVGLSLMESSVGGGIVLFIVGCALVSTGLLFKKIRK